MKLDLDDKTVIYRPDGPKEITLRKLLEDNRAAVIFVEAFRRYLAVIHNGQMLTGFETTREVFEEFSDEPTPWETWKVALAIACAVLISQVVVAVVVDLTGAQSLWWRPLLSTVIASVILYLV
jgi:uncharacterized PurR-regulated membrane protein YhhQ (DUF165 family)